MKPELSIIVAAVDDYRTVFEVIRAIEEQTVFEKLELLIVCHSIPCLQAPSRFIQLHPKARVIEVGRPLLLNEARTIGVENATAEFVFILEDHCLPRVDCMEKILARLKEGTWSVVGPSIECGNLFSIVGRAANLLTYGEWMGYGRGGERRYVTGYSSAWRRKSLLDCGEVLEEELAIPSRLQERLRLRGNRIFFEPAARMIHWEASFFKDVCHILFRQGLGMGYIRSRTSTTSRRLIASFLVPLLIVYRSMRAVKAWVRSRPPHSIEVLFMIPPLATIWSLGELIGYWTRSGPGVLAGVSSVERMRDPLIDGDKEPIRRPWAADDDVPCTT